MFRNQLCRDARCNGPSGCYHRGKNGTFCDFYAEEKLCEILNLQWHPGLELDMLLVAVKDKLSQLPGPDDYSAQIKLAQRNLPQHPATLTAPEEDQDGGKNP